MVRQSRCPLELHEQDLPAFIGAAYSACLAPLLGAETTSVDLLHADKVCHDLHAVGRIARSCVGLSAERCFRS